MEDRFLVFHQMAKVTKELEEGGFRHVITRLTIDPKWRAEYRPDRPELDPVSWTVEIDNYLIPMQQMKKLIEICENNGLTVWWDAKIIQHDNGNEQTLYLIARNKSAESGHFR